MAGLSVRTNSDVTEEEFDPRIKVELDSLNQAASDVNRLEKEINEARNKYQETFYECSRELEILRKKYGSKINKARPYYETKEQAKEAQSEAILSARKYQSANGIYKAAKETISLAELRLQDDKAASLSPAWQEMLNHALLRVMESEQEKTKSEKEHLEKSATFSKMEKRLHILEKKHKKAISKSRPYFDAKNGLELKLQQIKQSIEDLQQAMQSAKCQYSQSLMNLEEISDGIHEARRQKLILMYPREPGVGAEEETDQLHTELPSLPSTEVDLDLSTACKHYSDSDEEDDVDSTFDESTDNNTYHQNTNYDQEMNETSNDQHNGKTSYDQHNKQTNISSAPPLGLLTVSEPKVRIIGVKDKHKLRKSMSLPSYVEEQETISEVKTFEEESENVILRVESGTVAVDSSSVSVSYDQE